MNKFAKKSVLLALAAGLGTVASVAQAVDSVYVLDRQEAVVMSGTGLCWRDGYWTPAGAQADKNGCACDKDLIPAEVCNPAPQPRRVDPVPVTPTTQTVTLGADALFKLGKADLQPAGRQALDKLVVDLKGRGFDGVLVIGHTDRLGSDAANLKLSQKRAASVKAYLVKKGIPAAKISTDGKGEAQPVTNGCKGLGAESGKNKKLVACLQPDRRVVIEITGVK